MHDWHTGWILVPVQPGVRRERVQAWAVGIVRSMLSWSLSLFVNFCKILIFLYLWFIVYCTVIRYSLIIKFVYHTCMYVGTLSVLLCCNQVVAAFWPCTKHDYTSAFVSKLCRCFCSLYAWPLCRYLPMILFSVFWCSAPWCYLSDLRCKLKLRVGCFR